MTVQPDLSKLSSEEKDALILALLERVEELERRLSLNSSNNCSRRGIASCPVSFLLAPFPTLCDVSLVRQLRQKAPA